MALSSITLDVVFQSLPKVNLIPSFIVSFRDNISHDLDILP
jgi:hypothetical protein